MTLSRLNCPSEGCVPGSCSRLPGTNSAGCSHYKSTDTAISKVFPVDAILESYFLGEIFFNVNEVKK